MTTDNADITPAPEPATLRWLGPDAPRQLTELSHADLVHAAADVVGRAKLTKDDSALRTLGVLRTALLLRNERRALGMVLLAQAELATHRGSHRLAANAYNSLWGVRELLEQPFRALTARISHGEALFRAGDVAEGEAVLRAAQQPARALALGGEVAKAAACLADTLARLGGLLLATDRAEEGELWLEGARDLAPDSETVEAVSRTRARFLLSTPTGRSL